MTVALLVVAAVVAGLVLAGTVGRQRSAGFGVRDWQRRQRALRRVAGAGGHERDRARDGGNVRLIAGPGEANTGQEDTAPEPEHDRGH